MFKPPAELCWYCCGGGDSDLVSLYVTDANPIVGFFFAGTPNVSDTEWRRALFLENVCMYSSCLVSEIVLSSSSYVFLHVSV
ncbi:hypothetical protein F2Q69_00039989 [Brassica cretica]|uniref:Uncharacterized protein n=1 Tax=Brassica cretica TaxID=69181 RepID=A0A8S9NU16_BRACR|nr:hypothetical protein F2Q69_00039989 [Brassica cretica]